MSAVGPRSWVLVVGMHRSGTSAVAGALGALGCLVPGPEDRLTGPGNPEHHESRTLTIFDEELLAELGGTWDGPPLLRPHWAHSAIVVAGTRAREALLTAFPVAARTAWKDPRLCLLLPFWRRLLDGPVAAVLVWRPPLAVARSLQQRDDMHLASGLALWERYNRSALEGLRGLPVTVVEYDAVVSDPGGFAEDTTAWIEELGFPPSSIPSDTAAAATVIEKGLRHQRSEGGAREPFLTPEQERLAELLRGLDGHHRSLAASPPGPESPLTELLLEPPRRSVQLRRLLERVARQRESARLRYFDDRHRWGDAQAEAATRAASFEVELAGVRAQLEGCQAALDAVHESTSWKVTVPVRWAAGQIANRRR